jgi:GT2 family glycosyltransferase
MGEHKITTCISTNNNLEYLKLAIQSVRQNAYFNEQPIVIYAENCTDGTNEWLEQNSKSLQLTYRIEANEVEKGIGGGMNNCVDMADTEFVNIIHSDMWIAPNQDLELLKLYDNLSNSSRLIASSFRIQPKIFPNDPDYRPGTVFVPKEEFGAFYSDFNSEYFDTWATEFSYSNDITVRKAGGAGFFCRKDDYVYMGGNDPLFAPASWEDMDLFIRMQLEGYEFKMTSKSVVYHFSARGSHFRDEAKDNLNSKSSRQIAAEHDNTLKFINKWGRLPIHDDQTFVMLIDNKNVITKLDFLKNI